MNDSEVRYEKKVKKGKNGSLSHILGQIPYSDWVSPHKVRVTELLLYSRFY